MQAFNHIRQVVLQCLDIAQDRQCVMDSLPLPVVQFHLGPSASSSGDWKANGSTFGKVPSKKQTIFGYKLHLLIAMNGVILDFALAPANESDLAVGFELLAEYTDLQVLGDKAYINAAKAAQLWQENRIALRTIPRRNQQKQLPRTLRRLYNSIRQMIENVNAQLTNQFNIEVNYAHTFGAYALAFTPNWRRIPCVSTSTACSANLPSCKSRLWPFPFSIRPYWGA